MSEKLSLLILGQVEKGETFGLSSLCTSIRNELYDAEKLLAPFSPHPDVIICLPGEGVIPDVEIAQSLRMNYAFTPIFFVTKNNRDDFNRKLLIKNGFTDAFILPWESHELLTAMKLSKFNLHIPEMKDFIPVNVLDLKGKTVTGFDLRIHLPVNNKFLLFFTSDENLDERKIEKLLENHVDTLFIHKDEFEKFNSYTENQSKYVAGKNRLHGIIKEFVGELLIQDVNQHSFERSRELFMKVKDAAKLIGADEKKTIAEKIKPLLKQPFTFYNHSANVASYAGIFASALHIQETDEIVIAGFLHDIGKLYGNKSDLEMSEEEIYKLHPQRGIDLLRVGKVSVSDNVTRAILQHHEAMNGSGFPKSYTSGKICTEAKIIAIADAFDKLTAIGGEQDKIYSGKEALEHLLMNNITNPERMVLDVDMLKKLLAIY